MLLKDKVAMITGGGGVIGRTMALEFARQGASLVICDINGEDAKDVANQVREIGGKVLANSNDEYGTWHFDDVQLRISNATDTYYFRKSFKEGTYGPSKFWNSN